MRWELAGALASLADPGYQRATWIDGIPEVPGRLEGLKINVNVLYDVILPTPRESIGTVLIDGAEVVALERLVSILDALLDRLGESPDLDYIESPEWPEVVKQSGLALAAMVRMGAFHERPQTDG